MLSIQSFFRRVCIISIFFSFCLSKVHAQDNVTALCASDAFNLGNSCSGRGICFIDETEEAEENRAKCLCDAGYSGRSDWFNREGFDCQLNETAVLVLWSVQLAFITIVGFIGWPKMWVLIQRYQTTKRKMSAAGKPYPVRKNKALLSMLFYWAGCWPFHVLLCIVKVAIPDTKIGVDWAPSLFWLLARSFFYTVGYFFQPSLVSSLLKGRTDALSYVTKRSLQRTWKAIMGGMIASGFLVLVPVVYPYGYTPQGTLIAFNSMMFIVLVCMGSYSQVVKRHVRHILDDSFAKSNDKKILKVKDNLVSIQNEVTRQTFVQMLIYLLFGCWPFLWAKHDYLYPVSISVMPIIGFKGIHVLMANSNGKEGLRRGTTTGPSTGADSRALRPSNADRFEKEMQPTSSNTDQLEPPADLPVTNTTDVKDDSLNPEFSD